MSDPWYCKQIHQFFHTMSRVDLMAGDWRAMRYYTRTMWYWWEWDEPDDNAMSTPTESNNS